MKEISLDLVNKELEKVKQQILEQLQPHFGDELVWCDNRLCDTNGVCVLAISRYGKLITIDNKRIGTYFGRKFDVEDVFEEVGGDLTTLKIKEKKFDTNNLIKEIIEEFPLLQINDIKGFVEYNSWDVLWQNGNVNFWNWHKGILEGHPTFNFNSDDDVIVDSEEMAEEFKKVLRAYFRGLENMRYWDAEE